MEWYKCNTDGASRGNLGRGSYGFCVRNHQGDLIHAESSYIRNCSNTIAEAKAIKEALTFCQTNRLGPIILEIDSLSLLNIVSKTWKIR